MTGRKSDSVVEAEQITSNGLLHRVLFLTQRLLLDGAAGVAGNASAQAPSPKHPEWMTRHGAATSGFGRPSKFEQGVQRFTGQGNPLFPGVGTSRIPLEKLTGIITPVMSV